MILSRSSLPLALTLAATLPLGAQDAREVARATFQVFTPRQVSMDRMNDLCSSPALATAVHQVLFGQAAAQPRVTVSLGAYDQEDETCGFLTLGIEAEVPAELAATKREAAVQAVAAFLQQRLDELIRLRPLQADQKRLAELEAQAAEHERRYVQLRQELFASARNDVNGIAAMVADLDKQRLTLDLDLRTELAVHDQLREQVREVEERLRSLREDWRQRNGQRLEAERRFQALRGGAGSVSSTATAVPPRVDPPTAQQLAAVEAELEAVQSVQQDLGDELKRVTARLDRLQNDLQSAAANIHRMQPRLRIVTDSLGEQQKRLLEAEALAARHELAAVRLDEARSRWEALRGRAETLRARIEESEPVRVELWR